MPQDVERAGTFEEPVQDRRNAAQDEVDVVLAQTQAGPLERAEERRGRDACRAPQGEHDCRVVAAAGVGPLVLEPVDLGEEPAADVVQDGGAVGRDLLRGVVDEPPPVPSGVSCTSRPRRDSANA